MEFERFADELCISGSVLSIKRIGETQAYCPGNENCAFLALNYAFRGETIRLSADSIRCFGGKGGFGLVDSKMEVPGGYGHFVSYGAGEGAPPGMRLKASPELAEQGELVSPRDVMDGMTMIEIKPFEESDAPDLVTVLSTPDQLAALNLLFHFRKVENDATFFPAGSGCSSVFRLPFAELRSDNPRAVIGNADVSSRPGFPPDTLFFTVPGEVFKEMLRDADESFLTAAAWKRLRERISPGSADCEA